MGLDHRLSRLLARWRTYLQREQPSADAEAGLFRSGASSAVAQRGQSGRRCRPTEAKMKIQPYERVEYRHNPLAEVLCQVRFPFDARLAEGIPENLAQALAQLGYTVRSEEQAFNISVALPVQDSDPLKTTREATQKIVHFSSMTELYKVSLSAEYVALTCTKYTAWADFLPKLLSAYRAVLGALGSVFPIRVGLRYKDVISREREGLGLAGVPWSELIQPFLLGPLRDHALSDAPENKSMEEAVVGFVTQSTVRLAECGLVLQGALLRSAEDPSKTAFLIDSDFFAENDDPAVLDDESKLTTLLNVLHHNAGSLFERSITRRLHAALK